MRIRLIVILALVLGQPGASAETAIIATATNFNGALDALVPAFEASSEHRLQRVSAATGVLFNQISHGAPFAVLLAADSTRPQELEKLGLGVRGSRFTYALGQLALTFSPALPSPGAADTQSQAQRVISALQYSLQRGGKIAIANPQTAPYGIAAQQVMSHLGLWTLSQAQLVRAANAAQCFQYVASTNADQGLVALSLAQAQTQQPPLTYWPLPQHWHQPIRQQAILLQSARNNAAARDFLVFLKSTEAADIIRRYGYTLPEKRQP